jgi:hypothetical protein
MDENGPVIVDLPIKSGDFHWFSIVMLVYQRVTSRSPTGPPFGGTPKSIWRLSVRPLSICCIVEGVENLPWLVGAGFNPLGKNKHNPVCLEIE